jgi:cardiolipin synthase
MSDSRTFSRGSPDIPVFVATPNPPKREYCGYNRPVAWQIPRGKGKWDIAARGHPRVNLPNTITIARFLLVPVVVWAIASMQMRIAFWLFVAAALSDMLDGFLAKRFRMTSEFGAYLDPLADKAMLMSIYVSLALAGLLPLWLVIAVVSRDLMILGAIIVSWLVDRPLKIHPLMVSKVNTTAQFILASLVLGTRAFGVEPGPLQPILITAVGILTGLSAAAYLRAWMRHMAS